MLFRLKTIRAFRSKYVSQLQDACQITCVRNADVATCIILEENRDLVVRATAAYVRGARYAVENKARLWPGLSKIQKMMRLTAAAIYDEYVNGNLGNTDYLITASLTEFTHQIGVNTGALESILPYEGVATDKTTTEAINRLGQETYQR